MKNMKTVVFMPKRTQTLHIEAPGCIVNITARLSDVGGLEVTSVEVLADQYVGEEWNLPDYGNAKGLNIRVREVNHGKS